MNVKFERVKNGKYFLKRDIILYAAIVLLLTGLFLGVFLTRENTALEKIEVYYKEKLIYSYDFLQKSAIITETGANYVETRTDGAETEVKITTPDGYNKVIIGDGYALVADADCFGKDCIRNSKRISGGGDAIFCLPHGIKILGVGEIGNEVTL